MGVESESQERRGIGPFVNVWVQYCLITRGLRDRRKIRRGEIPWETFLPMWPFLLRVDSLESHPLVSGCRPTIYIHDPPRRRPVGTAGGERSIPATNLAPVGRGSRMKPGGIQLNRLFVGYHCSGSARLAAHHRKGLYRVDQETTLWLQKGRVV